MQGRQPGSNVSRAGIDTQACGQNLSGRPYLSGYSQAGNFILSDVYISRFDRRSCITALHGMRTTLEGFVNLRPGDRVIYLRTASLNVINGLVGLNFSCDGTHYLPVPQFLEKDQRFWFGG